MNPPTTVSAPLPLTLFTARPIAGITAKQRAFFQQYLNQRYRDRGAITPDERLAVLVQVRDELLQEGKFPYQGNVIQVPVRHPVIQALLAGQPVNLGSGVVGGERLSLRDRAQTLGTGVKLMIIVAVMAGMLVFYLGLSTLLSAPQSPVVAAAPPTLTVTVTASRTPAASVTPFPVTATPYSIAFITGDAASQAFDPASIELGGFSYVLSVGQVRNGEWSPGDRASVRAGLSHHLDGHATGNGALPAASQRGGGHLYRPSGRARAASTHRSHG